ncbi:DUF1963 domain-containing protein [Streptomyces sp. NPDC088182]|uniref:DUF1963 domain-containing protein n=1 Tax=Streptomyces sp. NPDC088182 TaxID=3365838 RepID=UPI00381F034C
MERNNIYSAAANLPDVSELKDRARILAALDMITTGLDCYEDTARYKFLRSGCPGNGGHVLRTMDYGDPWVEVHFHESVGTIVFGWGSEAQPDPDQYPEIEEIREEAIAQIPEGLRHCLWHGESETHGPGLCPGIPEDQPSVVAWRLPEDTEWQIFDFTFPEHLEIDDHDFVKEMLEDLTDFSAESLSYKFPEESQETSPEKVAAIEHIMAGRPLTEDIVRTLDPECSLAETAEAVAAIGTVEDRRIHCLWTIDDAVAAVPPEAREDWLSRLRPAARFRPRQDNDGPAVWRTGGFPELPDDVPWPVWQGYGELTHLATLDCALLPRELDIDLPEDGTLVFFIYTGDDGWIPGQLPQQYPSGPEGVDPRGGYKVIYFPASTAVSQRRPTCAPDLPDNGLDSTVLPAQEMVLNAVVPTWPHDDEVLRSFKGLDCLCNILYELNHQLGNFGRQIGGHPTWTQAPQFPDETKGAQYAEIETQDWQLLATFPCGEGGALYWLIHRDDLARRRFDKVVVRAGRPLSGVPANRQYLTNGFEKSPYQPVLDVLGPEMGEHWLSRTRPAFTFTAGEGDGPVIGQIHGRPSLPADMPWLEREGYGPMTHLATIDLAALPQGVLDFDLPEDGTLLFFRWSLNDAVIYEASNESDDEETYFISGRSTDAGAGCRVVYIPGSTGTAPRPTPQAEVGHHEDSRSLRLCGSFESYLSWDVTEAEYPLPSRDLEISLAQAFDDIHQGPVNQIGGHQNPVQGMSVENTALGDLRGPRAPQPGEDVMIMLAAIYDDHDDAHTYWYIRPDDLKQHRFDDIHYDHQR